MPVYQSPIASATEASITALQAQARTLAPMSLVDVRRFVAGGVLTDANIDDAIDGAIAYAIANTGPGLEGPSFTVYVPAGRYLLARAHVFPTFDTYRCAIGFCGAGMNETVFMVNSDVSGSAVFTFGAATFPPGVLGMQMYLYVSGFSVIPVTEFNCLRTALAIYGVVNPQIRDVRTRGLLASNASDAYCRGIAVYPVIVGAEGFNSQFVDIRDCDIYGCLIGLFVMGSYPVTLDNVAAHGCVQNAVFQGSKVTWLNSDIQGGGPLDAAYDQWYGNRDLPGVVSGWDYTVGLAGGTGATCSAQSGRLCTVTLPGATLDAREDKARWLRLTATGASDGNKLKVTGVYKIERVLSATTLQIRKGSNHNEQTGLDWQLCEARGEVTLTLDNVYNEASPALRATVGAWRDNYGGSEYVIRNSEFQGGQFVIEADRVKSVSVRDLRESNSAIKVARLEYVGKSVIERSVDQIEFDHFSYHGLECFNNQAFPSTTNTRGTRRSTNGGSQVRIRNALREMGSVETWDTRVVSSLSLTGAQVNSITGLQNGTVLAPDVGGLKPTYTTLDAELDGPAIVQVAGSGAARSFLIGSIAAAVLPDFPYTSTIVFVGRVPGASLGTYRRVQVLTTSGGSFTQHMIGLHDGQYLPTGFYSFYRNHNYHYPNQQGQAAYTATADAEPHVFIADAVSSVGVGAQVRSWDREVYVGGGVSSEHPSHVVGADMSVTIGSFPGATDSSSVIWSLMAVIPHPLSRAEHEKIVDCARNEWAMQP